MDKFSPEEHERFVTAKRKNRMDRIDNLAPEIRALVHEYGFNVVNAFLQLGITKHRQIRHLVETVLDEFSPTRGSFASQGIRTPRIMREPPVTSPLCPRPVNTAPEGKTAADCIRDGECGCDLSHRQERDDSK